MNALVSPITVARNFPNPLRSRMATQLADEEDVCFYPLRFSSVK